MVERALRSVLGQRRRPAEVIVVDDASGDETGSRAARLGARVITHERNLGRGAARNTGLGAACNDWVALLDSDDQWLPAHLETLWAARDGHLLVGTAALVTGPGREQRRVYGWAGRRPRRLRGAADVALPENKLVTSAVMLSRHAALAAGGFRTDMPRAEDLELWLRMLERGSAVAIPRITALYHVHPDQISVEAAPMWAAHESALGANGDGSLRTVRLRHEGVVAWDAARAARASGAPLLPAVLALARRLASPQRAAGVAQLLAARRRARRLAARVDATGAPAVAILPGVRVAGNVPEEAFDLRDRSFAAALLQLLRRPPSRALVTGRVRALLVRATGVEPVLARVAGP